MWLNLLAISGGIIVLVWGANQFVDGAAALANNLGVSPIMIGLTIVGLGTSAPEILVSAMAAIQGNPGLAIGNAVGSNIANIGFILGLTAMVVPLRIHSTTLKREYPVLLFASFLALALMSDMDLNRTDGSILLVLMCGLLLWLVRLALRTPQSDPMTEEYASKIPSEMGTSQAVGRFLLGLTVLLAGSRVLVWGSANIAYYFGVSDLAVGLTIVALGTSLPELAASVASTLKGKGDIAVGNIIGSNLINLLAVLSLPGVLAPGQFLPEVVFRDLPVMLLLTLAMFVMGYGFGNRPRRITRIEGTLLLATYVAYQGLLFYDLSQTAHL